MNARRTKYACLGWAFFLGCLASPFTPRASGQGHEQSPSSLVKFLTRPTDSDNGATFSCGVDYDARVNRAAAKALDSQGEAALPAVEEALDLLKKPGARYNIPNGLYWLLYAYAKIEGHTAFPRLWDLNVDPNLRSLGMAFSEAMALALGLTSYVPDTLSLTSTFRCTGPQPRDALNQLILAWERGDGKWLENALGHDAAAALQSLRGQRSWAEIRAALWSVKSSDHLAVGYQFVLQGRFSVPEMDLMDTPSGDSNLPGLGAPQSKPSEFLLATRFTDKGGKYCGTFQVKFLRHPSPPGELSFLVDNSDLEGLLRLINSCAAQ
jgi:hypothetical protein